MSAPVWAQSSAAYQLAAQLAPNRHYRPQTNFCAIQMRAVRPVSRPRPPRFLRAAAAFAFAVGGAFLTESQQFR